MSASDHRQQSETLRIRCAVLTVSDTRTLETDTSGALIAERLETVGHEIVAREIVRDETEAIRSHLLRRGAAADVVITTGGTGIAGRDRTIQAAESLIVSPIPGFGELFRMLSYEEVGAASMLSRAMAGLFEAESRTLLFCCPGSRNAVRLAMDALILEELPHIVWEARRDV
ncbi:MAG: MogA/MoaB family molybdenum cofactor biosynthesis protein [Bacteroidota bacterium]